MGLCNCYEFDLEVSKCQGESKKTYYVTSFYFYSVMVTPAAHVSCIFYYLLFFTLTIPYDSNICDQKCPKLADNPQLLHIGNRYNTINIFMCISISKLPTQNITDSKKYNY